MWSSCMYMYTHILHISFQEKSYSLQSSKGSVGYPIVTGCQENGDRPLKRENPHKYLLYKPTFSQVMVFLASGKILFHFCFVNFI